MTEDTAARKAEQQRAIQRQAKPDLDRLDFGAFAEMQARARAAQIVVEMRPPRDTRPKRCVAGL